MKRLAGRIKIKLIFFEQNKNDTIIIFNFSFVHFLEVSDRLSSPKLPVESSSSSLPSSPHPAASSRSNIHVIDVNNATLSTSENIPHKSDDDDDDDKNQQQSSPPPHIFNDTSTTQIKLDENTKKPKPKKRKQKSKEQQDNEKTILSNDSKHRAQILLEKLAQSIENRSKQYNLNHIHPDSSVLGIQHIPQRSSASTPDPFTNKLPPKSQRRSSSLKKNLNQNDDTTTNDTS